MRIPSGKTDQKIIFYAADATDLVTAETGLSSFTVYRSRNGGTATAYTTPTISELSSANMPGLYALTIDEDTTIASTSDSEEYAVTITATGMAPVHRVFELYRRDTTSGQTITVANGAADADIERIRGTVIATPATAGVLDVNVKNAGNTAWGSGAITAGSIASGAITSAKFAANALDAVWSTATRVLTAGTNIVLAKGTGVTGFNDPTANDNADALLDRAAGVETGLTVRQAFRLFAAALLGKASGLDTTTAKFRDTGDSKDRITATVDANGNRTSVTLDAS